MRIERPSAAPVPYAHAEQEARRMLRQDPDVHGIPLRVDLALTAAARVQHY